LFVSCPTVPFLDEEILGVEEEEESFIPSALCWVSGAVARVYGSLFLPLCVLLWPLIISPQVETCHQRHELCDYNNCIAISCLGDPFSLPDREKNVSRTILCVFCWTISGMIETSCPPPNRNRSKDSYRDSYGQDMFLCVSVFGLKDDQVKVLNEIRH
jgi:hypothetical protein